MPALAFWGITAIGGLLALGWSSGRVGEASQDLTRSIIVATVAGVAATFIVKRVLK